MEILHNSSQAIFKKSKTKCSYYNLYEITRIKIKLSQIEFSIYYKSTKQFYWLS